MKITEVHNMPIRNTQVRIHPWSPGHGACSSYGWRRRPADTEGCCYYIE